MTREQSLQAAFLAAIQSVGMPTFKATSMFSNGGANK